MRYRYSNTVVYNNFIWPDATDSEKEKITATAQAILDARALYPKSTLADLYDPLTMPPELRKAHEANDKAVLAAYGLKTNTPESDIVAHLFKLYARHTRNGRS
ncbi:MAG: methylase [Succinivibrio sp.]|nr:methylase [Succinivibrio sp.]